MRNEYFFGRPSNGSGRIPQKKNPFTKVESWRKPWIAKNHVYNGVKIYS